MPEKLVLKGYEQIISGVTGTNLVKAKCLIHGDGVYFERVEGDLFRCANKEHRTPVAHNVDSTPILGRIFDR